MEISINNLSDINNYSYTDEPNNPKGEFNGVFIILMVLIIIFAIVMLLTLYDSIILYIKKCCNPKIVNNNTNNNNNVGKCESFDERNNEKKTILSKHNPTYGYDFD